MDNCWNELPPFKPSLEKKGLEPHEFESILLSKISKIFKHQGAVVDDRVRKAVTELKRDVCIRENRTSDTLDQRSRRAIQNYLDHEILPNQHETPMHLRNSTGGQRNVMRSDRVQIKCYHSEQHELFSKDELLGREFRDLIPSIKLNKDKKGFFFHENDVTFKIEEACRVIDKFTCKFLRYLILLQPNCQVPPEEWAPQNIPQIRSCCRLIILRRRSVDWATPNDLLNNKRYDVWKKHVMIEMSYAALVVVLDVILKKQQSVALPKSRL